MKKYNWRQWFMVGFLLGMVLTLAACNPPEPVVKTVTVNVPTYIPCQVTVPQRPAWPDNAATLHAVPPGAVIQIGIDGQVEILIEGITDRDKYIVVLETALSGCTH